MTTEAIRSSLQDLVAIQRTTGNWDYSPYMRGLYNGMELALAILEDREPQYRDEPEFYIEVDKG